jgi:hypothetical protein
MSLQQEIKVVSHVARDLLQSAAVFKHEWLVVWEYVSNGLQYIDPGTKPVVRVLADSRRKKISITDNGRGMSWSDLQNFFIMHGENVDRKQGRAGRGYFGTGKSAAFGIASKLTVSSVRSERRCTVELKREDVDKVHSGAPIPVREIERDIPTDEPNGTVVIIEDIHIRTIDVNQIIKYIERHIARWPHASVSVNSHLCEYTEPPFSAEYEFEPLEEPFKSAIPGAKLIIRVAKAPLDEALQGIAVMSHGVWYEQTLGGSERKEMSQYIFGEFDVPTLANDQSPVPAFDLSRSMQLNRSNEQVRLIIAFLGLNVDGVRKQLVEDERKRRASEDAKRLQREAEDIAKILNSDFDDFRSRLAKVLSQTSGGRDLLASVGDQAGDLGLLARGGDIPAVVLQEEGEVGYDGGEITGGEEPPTNAPILDPAVNQTPTEQAEKRPGKPARRPRGGFSVKFDNLGKDQDRAKYFRDERTIFINLDHPQLEEALAGGGVEDVAFRRLAYEVAFAEYSLALSQEMAQAGHFMDIFEPLTEARYTLNRITRSAAQLYRSS